MLKVVALQIIIVAFSSSLFFLAALCSSFVSACCSRRRSREKQEERRDCKFEICNIMHRRQRVRRSRRWCTEEKRLDDTAMQSDRRINKRIGQFRRRKESLSQSSAESHANVVHCSRRILPCRYRQTGLAEDERRGSISPCERAWAT